MTPPGKLSRKFIMKSPLSENQLYNLYTASSKLSSALLKSHDSFSASYEIGECVRYLEESLNKDEEWKEEEAEWSGAFHTYLRKYEDSYAATLLWMMFNQNEGVEAWKMGIRSLICGNLCELEDFHPVLPKERKMRLAFLSWAEAGFDEASKFLKENL